MIYEFLRGNPAVNWFSSTLFVTTDFSHYHMFQLNRGSASVTVVSQWWFFWPSSKANFGIRFTSFYWQQCWDSREGETFKRIIFINVCKCIPEKIYSELSSCLCWMTKLQWREGNGNFRKIFILTLRPIGIKDFLITSQGEDNKCINKQLDRN